MKVLLHNEYKIINLWWYPTYVYQFCNFPYNYKNRVLACFQTRPVTHLILLSWMVRRVAIQKVLRQIIKKYFIYEIYKIIFLHSFHLIHNTSVSDVEK